MGARFSIFRDFQIHAAVLSAVLLGAMILPADVLSQAATFQGIGTDKFIFDVSNSHTAVGQTGFNAALWQPGTGWTNLGFVGAAYKSSADGSVVAGYFGFGGQSLASDSFRWTSGGGAVHLSSVGCGTLNQAFGISADGSTVVGSTYTPSSEDEGRRWTNSSGVKSLAPDLPSTYKKSRAVGASADGSVIVGYAMLQNDVSAGSYIWHADKAITHLDGSDGHPSMIFCQGISSNATTVIGQIAGPTSNSLAARWTSATGVVSLGKVHPDDEYTEADDITANGSIISGYYYPAQGEQTAFIWDAIHGMRDLKQALLADDGLDVGNWHLNQAMISDDGQTLGGTGTDPFGETQAWIAVVPEPAFASLGCGLICLAISRRTFFRSCSS